MSVSAPGRAGGVLMHWHCGVVCALCAGSVPSAPQSPVAVHPGRHGDEYRNSSIVSAANEIVCPFCWDQPLAARAPVFDLVNGALQPDPCPFIRVLDDDDL
jgi:hypothetical protein